MIHTRNTIYNTLEYRLHEIFKHGKYSSEVFKKIMYACILSDMKLWSEFIGDSCSESLDKILQEYLLANKEFIIDRFVLHDDKGIYRNINTPAEYDVILYHPTPQLAKEEINVLHYLESLSDPTEYVLDSSKNKKLLTRIGDSISYTTDSAIKISGFLYKLLTPNPYIVRTSEGNDIKLYYDRLLFNLSWNPNGGQIPNTHVYSVGPIKYGYSITSPLNPTKLGYIFNSWNPSVPLIMPANDLALVALWSPIRYYVNFLGNGHTNSADFSGDVILEFLYNVEKCLKENPFKKLYTVKFNTNSSTTLKDEIVLYLFKCWTDSSDDIIFEDKQSVINLSSINNSSYTLKALWEPKKLLLPSIKEDSKVFEGWYYDSNFTQFAGNANTLIDVNKDVTLYAKWTNAYKVTLIVNNGTPKKSVKQVNYGESAYWEIKPNEGYKLPTTVINGTIEDNIIESIKIQLYDILVIATCTRNEYKVTYNANGGIGTVPVDSNVYTDTNNSVTVLYPKTGDIVKSGYRFKGWSLQNSGNLVEKIITINSDVTLYAVWEKEYTVTLNMIGAKTVHPVSNVQKLLKGQKATWTIELLSGYNNTLKEHVGGDYINTTNTVVSNTVVDSDINVFIEFTNISVTYKIEAIRNTRGLDLETATEWKTVYEGTSPIFFKEDGLSLSDFLVNNTEYKEARIVLKTSHPLTAIIDNNNINVLDSYKLIDSDSDLYLYDYGIAYISPIRTLKFKFN